MRRRSRIAAQFMAALALASCQQLGLPEQGFVTRDVGSIGGLLRDTFEAKSDLDGRTLAGEGVPTAVPSNEPEGKCNWAARNRAQDAEAQGFDENTQNQVYELTLKDCRAWASRH